MSFAPSRTFQPVVVSCTPEQPLLVLRGVSVRETIRSRAAKVIAVTAMHFDVQRR
jgi:hypothetical protein